MLPIKTIPILTIAILFVSSLHAVAKTEPDDVTIDHLSLSEQLYFLRVSSSRGNTTSVVYTDGLSTLLVDPNFNQSSEAIKQHLKLIKAGPIRYLTSSHDHRDHIEQYAKFSQDAMIIIPNSQAESVKEWGGLADITFHGELTLNIGQNKVKLFTLPNKKGHTNGDLVAYFPDEKSLYVGDYYFASGFPIIDIQSGDLNGYLANLAYLIDQFSPTTQVIPGHTTFTPEPMRTITISDLDNYREGLISSIDWIMSQKNLGLTLEEIKSKGLPSEFDAYHDGLTFVKESKWIAYVYQQNQ